MDHIQKLEKHKESGAIVHLKAYGACDTWLTGIKGESMPCNIRNSMNYWFVENHDGFPTKDNIEVTEQAISFK